MKTAIIFGANGMDGSHLTDLLLSLNYDVWGVIRPSSGDNTYRLNHVLDHPSFHLERVDVVDYEGVNKLIQKVKPTECYNLAAQSHVGLSFEYPALTYDSIINGTTNILNAITAYAPDTHYYNASSSEMYGINKGILCQDGVFRQTEYSRFEPCSPYAVAKVASHHLTNISRRKGIHASCGILFNHDGFRRGSQFFTRKVSLYCGELLHSIVNGKPFHKKLRLGNLSACRDIGFAPDYVEAMYLMLQQDTPDDYIIATGKTYTMEEVMLKFFECINVDPQDFVEIDSSLLRPSEVPYLCGDATRAKNTLKWKPKHTLDDIVKKMVERDYIAFSS